MSDDQDTPASDGASGGGQEIGAETGSGGRFVLWALVALAVFVGGGAFYHLSSENADKWFLEVRDGDVVVRKGIWFPTGAADYDEGGPAYAPVPLPEGMDPPPRVHDSSESVDNAIYRMLIALASTAIESGDAGRIESAKGLLGRARLLAGISLDQADEVLRYRGDIAMAEGHLAIKEVQGLLARAKQRVLAGVAKGTRLYKDPQGWARWIDAKQAEFSSLDDAREPPASLCAPSPPIAPGPAAPALAPASAPPVAVDSDPAPDLLPNPAPPEPVAPNPLAELTGTAEPTIPDPPPPPAPTGPAAGSPIAPPPGPSAAPDSATPAVPPPSDTGLSFPLFPEAATAPPAAPTDKGAETAP